MITVRKIKGDIMQKIFKNIVINMALIMSIMLPGAIVGQLALASPVSDACAGIKAAGGSCGNKTTANAGFKRIVTNVINVLSVVVGAVAVIMIIIGGFRYVISNGDSNSTKGAKDTILYAIIGLVVVLFSQIIVAFVLDRATQ